MQDTLRIAHSWAMFTGSGMLYIGNQTSCWAATPCEPFDYALAQGFDAFEWFPDKKSGAGWDEADLGGDLRQTLRDKARARGVRLSVHAKWQEDASLANVVSPGSSSLELARDLGAALLNVHLFHDGGLPAFVDALLPLIQETSRAGLQLSIENTPQHSPEQFNELFSLLRNLGPVDTRHVGMCLDLGHANLCAATRNDYLRFIDRLDSRVPLIHLHLHENWGDADTHLPLFTGPSSRDDSGVRGLVARLKRRNFSGSVIFEQWPHPPALLDNAREKLLRLWDSSAGTSPRGARHKPVASEKKPEAGGSDETLTAELVAGDRRWRSWREKLDFVLSLLAREAPALTTGQLVDIAIYLRLLGTGEIACVEDGRHFRPAHHARIASQIREHLVRLTTPENTFIVRKIYPWLPSSSPAFRHPEPLTRIRDIAHRNDIDPDLKRELKTTLQNKLHRCAGPEDLATASALLQRITAPGANHSPAFVEQFKIFHAELSEFFNATSLDARLAALIPASDAGPAGSLREFQRLKAERALPGRLATLGALTALRESLLDTAARHPTPEAQELVLADIALEDFAFVLLSEVINDVERAPAETRWESELDALCLALRNLELSLIEPDETRAVLSELGAWGKLPPPASRDDLLRTKATLLRCRRLAEKFSTRVVALLSRRVKELGHALGVAEPALRVFAESEVRGQNVFQVSKLAASLLRGIRERLGLPGWDVVVSGRAVGRVKALSTLDEIDPDREGALVLLLKSAAGDEEIPANVAGIVLAHEMPHLSHLAIRARQAGAAFAACEEAAEFERLRSLEGRMVVLVASPDEVAWEQAAGSGPETAAVGPPRLPPTLRAVAPYGGKPWLPLEMAVTDSSGRKAAGACRLSELSIQKGAGFTTPPGLVVPFGVMDAELGAVPALRAQYYSLVRQLDGMPIGELGETAQRLREIIQQLSVPGELVAEITRRFPSDRRLIVRSSANCEDLEDFAGAGLYESVLNVAPPEAASAICTVWASLWTERAVLSRRQAGIPHEHAHMAVLIQELLAPDFSFVLHTVNPLSGSAGEVYAEIVLGLGEALASPAAHGTPYRMVCNKTSGAATTLAFASFSQASRPEPVGGLRRETVDYSRVALSLDADARLRLASRLASIGRFVEEALGGPQDIEGAVVNDRFFLVQTRPQTGLPLRTE